jgi:hypothetical protein
MHIFMWSLSYVLVFLTLWSQWVWVPFCWCCCSRNNWRCVGSSAHSQGRWCHHVHIRAKLGWSMILYPFWQSMPLSTTSFQCYLGNKYHHLLHAFLQLVSCTLSCVQPCVGCIMAWLSLFLMILVSFSKHPNNDLLLWVVMSLMVVCEDFINIQ